MYRKVMCLAFMLAALAALALTGCSSDTRDNGGSSEPVAVYSVVVKNVYQAEVADATKVRVGVSYAGDSLQSGSAEGKNVVYDKDAKTCSFDFAALDANAKLLSVTIADANFASPMAFEWFTVAAGVKLVDGVNEVDIEENEFAGGEGSSENPYQVGNPRQLDNVRNYLDKYFEQCANINFAGSCGIANEYDEETGYYNPKTINDKARFYNGANNAYGFEPIGIEDAMFAGAYDGREMSIADLVQYGEAGVGLFGVAQNASLQNIILDSSCSCAGGEEAQGIGSLVGLVYDGLTIDNCQSASAVGGYKGVGGLVGSATAVTADSEFSVKGCQFSGNVDGDTEVGGIVGLMTTSDFSLTYKSINFANCVNSGTISGYEDIGGICGASYYDILEASSDSLFFSNCHNKGALCGTSCVAGICGFCCAQCNIAFADCSNIGELKGNSNSSTAFGGIAGDTYANEKIEFTACTNESNITLEGEESMFVGGIVDFADSLTDDIFIELALKSCTSSGSLTAGYSVGGLMFGIGGNVNVIACDNCNADAAINLGGQENSQSGGLFGCVRDITGMTITGTNKVSGKISYGDGAGYIGGAIGKAYAGFSEYGIPIVATEEQVKDVFQNVTVASGVIESSSESAHIGTYSGNPWVDSL